MSQVIKCPSCNSTEYKRLEDKGLARCTFCRSTFPLAFYGSADEKTLKALEDAKVDRFAGNYDKALSRYESLLQDNQESHELYFESFLAKYKYEYLKLSEEVVITHRYTKQLLNDTDAKEDHYLLEALEVLSRCDLNDDEKNTLKEEYLNTAEEINKFNSLYKKYDELTVNNLVDVFICTSQSDIDYAKTIEHNLKLSGLTVYTVSEDNSQETLAKEAVYLDNAKYLVNISVNDSISSKTYSARYMRYLDNDHKNRIINVSTSLETFPYILKNIEKNIYGVTPNDIKSLSLEIKKNINKKFEINTPLNADTVKYLIENIENFDINTDFGHYVVACTYVYDIPQLTEEICILEQGYSRVKKENLSALHKAIKKASNHYQIDESKIHDLYTTISINLLTAVIKNSDNIEDKIASMENIALKGNYDAYLEIADYYNSVSLYEKSKKYYQLALDHGEHEASIPLGHYFEEDGEYDKAIEYYKHAVDNNIPNGNINLGILYYKLKTDKSKNIKRAKEYLIEVEDHPKYGGKACYYLYKICNSLKEDDMSLHYLNKSCNLKYEKACNKLKRR